MKRETVDELLTSIPLAEPMKDTYRRVLRKMMAVEIDGWRAADLLRIISKPAWGSSYRYTALSVCRRLIAWNRGHAHLISVRILRSQIIY
jgi:hypothetical protein